NLDYRFRKPALYPLSYRSRPMEVAASMGWCTRISGLVQSDLIRQNQTWTVGSLETIGPDLQGFSNVCADDTPMACPGGISRILHRQDHRREGYLSHMLP